MTSRFLSTTGLVLALLIPALASAQTFTDVPEDSALFPAVEYLKAKGIIQTAPTFNPAGKLTRAQAAKVLVAPLVSPEDLATLTSSTFTDVPPGQWYTPYVEAARQIGIVDSAALFNPAAPVTKAAFMKMLLSAKQLDYKNSYAEIQTGLSSDVSSAADWFYPVMRFGLASSMTAVTNEGLLSPSRELSRSDMALIYYRLEMYQAGRRTQALLSQAETDIGNVLQMLEAKNIDQAEWASTRAVMASRGALTSKPDEPLVKGAMKISEGFQYLVVSYKAGATGRLDDAIAAAKAAYASADKAKAFAPGLTDIANQMQTIAKNMADEARALQGQQ